MRRRRTDEGLLCELLELELGIHERRLEAGHIERVREQVRGDTSISIGFGKEADQEGVRVVVAGAVHAAVERLILSSHDRIVRLRKRDSDFRVAFARAIADEDKRELVLGFARDLGADKRQIRGDRKAFGRWFGEDAVRDRYVRRLGDTERFLSFLLGRYGVVTAWLIENCALPSERAALWGRLQVEDTLKSLLAYDGDPRVVCAAFKSLSRALKSLPPEVQERSVDESTLQFIYRSAMQARQDIWIQCEALSLLQSLSPSSLFRVLERRLGQPGDGDDIFLRRKAVQVLARNLERSPDLEYFVPVALRDPSAFVRQAVAEVIPRLPGSRAERTLRTLALDDAEPPVRGAALVEGLRILEAGSPELRRVLLDVIVEVLRRESDSWVLRVAITAARDGARFLSDASDPLLAEWRHRVREELGRLHTEAEKLSVRRWAAQARESVWCAADPRASALLAELGAALADKPRSSSTTLERRVFDEHDEDMIGRVLSIIAQDDHGFDVVRGGLRSRIVKGHDFGFRLWRFIHEFRHPSPDKRQAHPHTIGRIFRGDLRAPSAVLCELAETKVPGEPLYIGAELGWRPYLPLVDDVLSSTDSGLRAHPVRLYTSEGVTEIVPPRRIDRRVRAYLALTSRFPHYAKLRNWKSKDDGAPKAYIEALEKLGFEIRLRPHTSSSGEPFALDPSVARFFPMSFPLIDQDFVDGLGKYFVSVYENTLWELAVFAALTIGVFGGRHFLSNYTLRRARNAIPLVIGGWGTRGKSGTERLKAALFSALGYGFVSKTTGCEAMFLYAHAFGRTREMFLFRPYDKATIWEQRDVVRMSERLGTEVFLWECMGLTPTYVGILQRQWMRDDISTITNTYPDHEDLQGPAGIDIPQVMCEFIPERGTLLTSEEQMIPILAEASRDLSTTMWAVGWLEAGLLTRDVLERFPYEEHPFNIALVLALAGELGIDREYALKEMADRVVADIGVLKTYPPAPVRSRKLEFTNGMSANERHGCLGNWTRLGFDRLDAVENADAWIVTVVNNRADRIARSRVFADILVRDVAADRHVLIGNNLMGLEGYIREAWEANEETISLAHAGEGGEALDPVETLRATFARFRLPTDEAYVRRRLEAMLAGQEVPVDVARLVERVRDTSGLKEALVEAGLASVAEEIAGRVEAMFECVADHDSLRSRLEGGATPGSVDEELREVLWKWFRRKLVIVEDYFATGNQVIDRIASATPPGLSAKIMGLQNIKGTGLDFVYRFQAWETCHEACRLLRGTDLRDAERGLAELANFREYGVLSEEFVRETLEIVRRSPAAQREQFQAELTSIEQNLNRAMRDVQEQLSGGSDGPKSQWLERVCGVLEEVFDAGDAVKRRKIANRIYRDLIAERVSSERAALELQALNKRQKGGWLLQRLQRALDVVAKRRGMFLPKKV